MKIGKVFALFIYFIYDWGHSELSKVTLIKKKNIMLKIEWKFEKSSVEDQ